MSNEEKLVRMLKYVSEHNDFYKKRIKEYGITNPLDITQWPVLTRKELQENRYNMFSNGYKNKYYWQQLVRKSSSGSTGVPINVYWDYGDYYSSMKILWRMRKKFYDILPMDDQLTFSFVKKNKKTMPIHYINDPKNILNIDVETLLNEVLKDQLIGMINTFNPKWIYIRPSLLTLLLSLYKKENKRIISLKYIETYGELLPDNLRKDVSDFFGVPVANMYGSEEVNTIAYECPFHNMHILEDNVFVGCLENGSFSQEGEGKLILTSLKNKAMPTISYDQGDRVTIEKLDQPCKCGLCSAVIKKIHGRNIEMVEIDNETRITPLMFLDIMATVNNIFDSMIKCYKFVYSKKQRILTCYLEINDEFSHWIPNIKKCIRELCEENMKDKVFITLEIIIKPPLDITKGKNRIFEIID